MKKYSRKIIKIIKEYTAIFLVLLFLLSSIGVIGVLSYGTHNSSNKLVYAKQNTVSPAPPASTLPSVFRDEKNGTSIAIQLVLGTEDTGRFDFFVPDEGYYRGVIPLVQSGKQIIHPRGTATAKFYPLNKGDQTEAAIRMEGEINSAHNKANINIWVNGTKHHLKTVTVDKAAAVNASKQAVSNIISKNWPALYDQLSQDVKATMTQTEFDQIMTENASNEIILAQLDGEGQIKEMTGYSYFTQPIILTVKEPNGNTATYHNNQYFVLEDGIWRLLTTDTPIKQ